MSDVLAPAFVGVVFAAQQVETMELTEENVEKVLDEVRTGVGLHGAGPGLQTENGPYNPSNGLAVHSQVRPYLMADGGNVEFVEIDGLVVKLKLAGACGSCPSSLTTMTMGIKRRLMEKIPVGLGAGKAKTGRQEPDGRMGAGRPRLPSLRNCAPKVPARSACLHISTTASRVVISTPAYPQSRQYLEAGSLDGRALPIALRSSVGWRMHSPLPHRPLTLTATPARSAGDRGGGAGD